MLFISMHEWKCVTDENTHGGKYANREQGSDLRIVLVFVHFQNRVHDFRGRWNCSLQQLESVGQIKDKNGTSNTTAFT